MASVLFGAMAERDGLVEFEPVAWFNGGLFDDDAALPLERDEIETALKAAALDWSEIDPSILGTLFERGLDPDKRSQFGAHYTDRDKIMRIVEPVIVRPLLAEWEIEKEKIAAAVEKENKARRVRRRRRRGPVRISASQGLLNTFLRRLQDFTVLDPACGSGNFLYMVLKGGLGASVDDATPHQLRRRHLDVRIAPECWIREPNTNPIKSHFFSLKQLPTLHYRPWRSTEGLAARAVGIRAAEGKRGRFDVALGFTARPNRPAGAGRCRGGRAPRNACRRSGPGASRRAGSGRHGAAVDAGRCRGAGAGR